MKQGRKATPGQVMVLPTGNDMRQITQKQIETDRVNICNINYIIIENNNPFDENISYNQIIDKRGKAGYIVTMEESRAPEMGVIIAEITQTKL